jgi:hypothetical protein
MTCDDRPEFDVGDADPVSAATTHMLHTDDGRVIPVRREEGHEGGWVLYTRLEWEETSTSDWEQRPDGVVTFQGRPTGATLKVQS